MKEFIVEGIDIDKRNKIVTFNSNHELGVNTSEVFNPTYKKFEGFDVISIFKRNDRIINDGNPLIYALKGLQGWKISPGDISKLLKQFIKITNKIESKYDTIVVIPSKNDLNTNFLHRLNKIIKCDNIVEGLFTKMPLEDVYDNYVNWKDMDYQEEQDMNECFEEMQDSGNDYFSFKYITPYLRKYILKSMWTNKNVASKNESLINDKNILVLDDTIAMSHTLSEFCKNIMRIFEPKSITIITLFSSLK